MYSSEICATVNTIEKITTDSSLLTPLVEYLAACYYDDAQGVFEVQDEDILSPCGKNIKEVM